MTLDYTQGCVNFRDVSEWVNELAGRDLVPAGRLLRGLKIDAVIHRGDIGNPATTFNLRRGVDSNLGRLAPKNLHFPISNDFEKYDTKTPEVRAWLQDIVVSIEKDVTDFPLLIHCTSGKDRTGVVVASLLSVLGIEREIID